MTDASRDFDEHYYLSNPDVADAVRRGMAPCDNKDEITASWREMAAQAADLPPPRRKGIARLFGAGR